MQNVSKEVKTRQKINSKVRGIIEIALDCVELGPKTRLVLDGILSETNGITAIWAIEYLDGFDYSKVLNLSNELINKAMTIINQRMYYIKHHSYHVFANSTNDENGILSTRVLLNYPEGK